MNVDWSSTGMSAAAGVIGFLAKDLWDRWRKSSDSRRMRRERLKRLADLLETSGSLYRSQRMQAQRLFDSVGAQPTRGDQAKLQFRPDIFFGIS